jgi:hypothetical protein
VCPGNGTYNFTTSTCPASTITATIDPDLSNNRAFADVFTKFFGLVGLNSVNIGASKALVDGFDSSTGSFLPNGTQVNVLSNGTITAAGTIRGSMRSTCGGMLTGGVLQCTQTGNVVLQSGTTVTGDVYAGGTITPSSLVRPTWKQNYPTKKLVADPVAAHAVMTTSAFGANVVAPSNGWTYTAAGDLTVNGSGNVLRLRGGSTAATAVKYYFRNLTLSGNASITITGWVVIQASGLINASGGSFSNGFNIPAELQILSSNSGANGVSLSGGSQAYLTVYAPQTDVVIAGGSPLFGAILGKTITSTGNAQLHIDLNIPGGSTGWAPGLHFAE